MVKYHDSYFSLTDFSHYMDYMRPVHEDQKHRHRFTR